MIEGFKPIVANKPQILILGSMPSITSLKQQEYYGFKYNRFWKIIATCFQTPLFTYEEKIQCIKKHHLALWDVMQSCDRKSSLDSDIRNFKCNDIESFLKKNPSITHILCNGKKSYEVYQKHFKHIKLPCIALPSTSNANRTIAESLIFETWISALKKRHS
ncbi:MAG: DNA-deoxyinosine glycosylase [Breznakia sp.]